VQSSSEIATINKLKPNRPFGIVGEIFFLYANMWGTGIRGLMRGMATLPQGNQELLVVKDKVGRPPAELGGKQVHGI